MTIKVQSTKITETQNGFLVEMIVSTAPDLEETADLVHLRVTLDTDERYPRLAKLQEIALRHARDGLETEIQRLQRAEGRKP